MPLRHLILSLAAGLFSLAAAQASDTYRIDPAHTSLTFSVRHMGLSNVKGHFDDFAGSLVLNGSAIAQAEATIQVKSINTGVAQRDNHLRTPDFFDAAAYPEITFKTRKVELVGGQPVLVADFTMRGVTKELRLPVVLSGPIQDLQGNTRLGLAATVRINRKDYGIAFNAALESGVALVGEEVALEINAEAVKVVAR